MVRRQQFQIFDKPRLASLFGHIRSYILQPLLVLLVLSLFNCQLFLGFRELRRQCRSTWTANWVRSLYVVSSRGSACHISESGRDVGCRFSWPIQLWMFGPGTVMKICNTVSFRFFGHVQGGSFGGLIPISKRERSNVQCRKRRCVTISDHHHHVMLRAIFLVGCISPRVRMFACDVGYT